jgi:hypothetical protein
MIKLSNLILDENSIETINSTHIIDVPTIEVVTKSQKVLLAFYNTIEARDRSYSNLCKYLNVQIETL